MSSPKSLLLIDQQTLNHLLAGVRALQMLLDNNSMSIELFEIMQDGGVEALESEHLDTLAENLNTGFFEPQQAEVLPMFYDPDYDSIIAEAVDAFTGSAFDEQIQIDPNPMVSPADEGCLVSAWVWVPGGEDDDAAPTD